MNRRVSILVVGLLSLGSFAVTRAHAQGREDVRTQRDDARTEYDFRDGSDVEGRRVPGPGDAVPARVGVRRHSLIEPRVNFVPELRENIESK